MKLKLLLITVLSFILTAFTHVAETLIPDEQPESLAELISEYSQDYKLTAQGQKLLLPRQTNYASCPQTKTISKRQINKRTSYRYTFYISGRPVDLNTIRTYQQVFCLHPTGLNESYRFFISLCKLII